MPPDPELDYLEKLFGDAYRKEIEQEENVWRTLPFFAATLALQLAGLTQVRDWVAGVGGALFRVTLALLGTTALATFAALLFLAESIWPAKFRYVTSEPDLRKYIEEVRTGAAAGGTVPEEDAAAVAIKAARTTMVQQYALGAAHNRAINQRRANRRTRAGLATLASVLAVLVLVALVVVSNLHGHERASTEAGPSRAGRQAAVPFGPAQHQPGDAAANDGGLQGLVERPHDVPASSGPGAGRP